jgi:hypothetical protein
VSDAEPHDQVRTYRYFWSGLVVGGILGAGVVMPGGITSLWIEWGVAASIAIGFAYASARWGDAAWIWLSDRVRLLWPWW